MMGTADELPWFHRAENRNAAAARRTAWRRQPKRMLLRKLGRSLPQPGTPVDLPSSTSEVLARLAELPVGYWTYAWEDPEVRHLGPMAQDFWTAFGLGTTDRQISSVDVNGVVLASVKALLARVASLESEVASLKAKGSSGEPSESPPSA